MNCEIIFEEALSDKYGEEVWDILCECDSEFVPPLSSRESSFQPKLSKLNDVQNVKPKSYFEIMKKQHFLLALKGGKVIAFMTFRGGYFCPELSENSPSNYITTICVLEQFRRQGVAEMFYDHMINHLKGKVRQPFITTRTWSSNKGHIKLLGKLGFVNSTCLVDHRGIGVDTVYFSKVSDI